MVEKRAKEQEVQDRILQEGKEVVNDLLGVNEWKRSKLGVITGFSGFSTTARRSFGGPVANLGRGTLRIIKKTFAREKVAPLPTGSENPSERFRVAQQVYGCNEEDIADLTRGSGRQALIYFVALVLSLCWGIYLVPTTSRQLLPPLGYLFPFFLVIPTVALFLRASFYNWQLRHRRLGSFQEFVRSGEVLAFRSRPESVAKRRTPGGGVTSVFLLALVAAFLVPSLGVLADGGEPAVQAGEPFNWTGLGEDDLFHMLLRFIIPGVGPIGGPLPDAPSPYVYPLSKAFEAFNATILLVGSAMLGWFVLAGTIASAHEGKVLGSRWHYIWAPVRVTAGIGFLAPVAGGWCAAQLLVLQLIVWGSGIGNTVWTSYVASFDTRGSQNALESLSSLDDPSNNTFTISTAQSVSLIRDIAAKAVCYVAVAEYEAQEAKQRGGSDYVAQTRGGRWGLGKVPLRPSREFPLVPVRTHLYELGGKVETIEAGSISPSALRSKAGNLRYRIQQAERAHYRSNKDSLDLLREELDITERLLMAVGQDNSATLNNLDILGFQRRWTWDFGPLCGRVIITEASPDGYLRMLKGSEVDVNRLKNEIRSNYTKIVGQLQNVVFARARSHAIAYMQIHNDPTITPALAISTFRSARENYEQTTTEFARNLYQLFNQGEGDKRVKALINQAREKGWASSGVFYMTLSRLQGAMFSLADVNVEVTNIEPDVIDKDGNLYRYLFGSPDEEEDTSEVGVLTNYAMNFRPGITGSGFDEASLMAGTPSPSSSSFLMRFLDRIFGHDMESLVESFSVSPQNPLVDMVAFGHRLVGYFLAAFASYMAIVVTVSGYSRVLDGIPLVGRFVSGFVGGVLEALLSTAGVFVKFVMFLILIVGITHAYILPMIPYIMVLFFVVGMLTLTVEALVAAPIWAFFHIRMDGQEFVDNVQRPGYMIAFNLVLRPALAVMGLILSYSVFGASILFLKTTFYPAIVTATAGTGYGILGVLTMLIILSYLHWQLAIRSFSLITSVPDRVTRWFGQGGENLGEESEATKSTQFLVGNITNRTERGLAAFGMAGRPRNQNDPETPSDPNKKKKVGAGDSPASGSANDSPSV